MTKNLITIEGQKGLTLTGWDLSKLTEEQWNSAGEILVKLDQARQWWLGDWWNACRWGDGKEACERIGVNYENARVCGHVSEQIQLLRRRNNLTFSHHREVCPIDDEAMQDRLLDWAEAEKATVRALREKVQDYLSMADWSETEKARRFDVEAGKTVVANTTGNQDANLINWAKSEGKYVFIGRGQYDLGWGNPYELDKDGDRDAVCDHYRNYFFYKTSLHFKISKLIGKVLGCYCYPKRCHGEILANLANEIDYIEDFANDDQIAVEDAVNSILFADLEKQ